MMSKRGRRGWLAVGLCLLAAGAGHAQVTLTSMVEREQIGITVYSPAVSLVQEQRVLSLHKGTNEFRVSWGEMQVYRDSVRLEVPAKVTVKDAVWPEGDGDTVIWHLDALQAGPATVSLLYYVKGFRWEASHVLTLDEAEKTLLLTSYADIANGSGESYEQAALRLVLGDMRLLSDNIAATTPPGVSGPAGGRVEREDAFEQEGFAEYTFFDLKRREDLDAGYTKRVLLASSTAIPARRVYVFDPRQYGARVAMQYWFENKREYGLGPVAPGLLRAFRVEREGRQALLGEDRLPYVPVGETARIHLGSALNVLVQPAQTSLQQMDEQWDRNHERLLSYTEEAGYRVTVKNRQDQPVEVVLRQTIPAEATLTASTPTAERPEAGLLEWRLRLAAGQTLDVTYATSRKVRRG